MKAIRILLLLALVTAGTATAVDARSKWWFDPGVQRHLELTPAQVQRIDEIFERTRGDRLVLRTRMEQATDALTGAMREGDEQKATGLASTLAMAQTAHGRARQVMLVRMLRVLSPVQRRKLSEVTLIMGRAGTAR